MSQTVPRSAAKRIRVRANGPWDALGRQENVTSERSSQLAPLIPTVDPMAPSIVLTRSGTCWAALARKLPCSLHPPLCAIVASRRIGMHSPWGRTLATQDLVLIDHAPARGDAEFVVMEG